MFFNFSLQVVFGFANVTNITTFTGKFVKIIVIEFLELKKLSIFNGENSSTILAFLQYLSQICLSLILVAFEKVSIYGNLK